PAKTAAAAGQKNPHPAPEALAEPNRRARRHVRQRSDAGGRDAASRRGFGQRQLARRESALAHLEAALRTRGKPEIVGNEDATERVPPLQVFEQIDDVGFGTLVE